MVDFDFPADATFLGDGGSNTRLYRFYDPDADVYIYTAIQQGEDGGVGIDVIPSADVALTP